tara:strand:+ start:186 stop:494 length:309 start_codon:yes stop_codon:yes gene_type:complete
MKANSLKDQLNKAIENMEEIMSRELLGKTIEGLIDVCNNIYCHIDRSQREEISDVDFELVKTFNLLVETNQRNLDILYPERQKPKVRTLSFHNVHNNIEEVS